MRIEPQSKSEARVLKGIRFSQHWIARFVVPVAICSVPLVFIIGGLYLWRIGQAQADAFVVCFDTGKDLVPCPELPPFSYFPAAFFLIMGFFFVAQTWSALSDMRDRRVMNDIVTRIEEEAPKQTPVEEARTP